MEHREKREGKRKRKKSIEKREREKSSKNLFK
jgi:hypothetical protein